VGVVIPPGVVGPEVENFVVAAAASEFSGPVAAFVDVGFVVDFAEPQAYVDIALAFDFSDPVSVVAVEGDSPGRPSFLAFPNVDHYASSSSRVGGVRDLSVHSSTGVRTSYGFCSILSNQGPHQNKNSGHC
jgi:hypothetical protein